MAPAQPEPFMAPEINEQFKQIVTGQAVAQGLDAPDLTFEEKPNKASKKAEPEPEPVDENAAPDEPEPEKKAPAKKAAAKKAAAK